MSAPMFPITWIADEVQQSNAGSATLEYLASAGCLSPWVQQPVSGGHGEGDIDATGPGRHCCLLVRGFFTCQQALSVPQKSWLFKGRHSPDAPGARPYTNACRSGSCHHTLRPSSLKSVPDYNSGILAEPIPTFSSAILDSSLLQGCAPWNPLLGSCLPPPSVPTFPLGHAAQRSAAPLPGPGLTEGSRAVVLNMGSLDHQHQHQLATCNKCKFPGPARNH